MSESQGNLLEILAIAGPLQFDRACVIISCAMPVLILLVCCVAA
jgi:hypothetical protein